MDQVPLSDEIKQSLEHHFRRALAEMRRDDRAARIDRAAIGLSRMLVILAITAVLVLFLSMPTGSG